MQLILTLEIYMAQVAQEIPRPEKLISFWVVLLANLLLTAGLTVLFLLIKIPSLPICASPNAGALSLAIILLLSFHLTWRLFHKQFRRFGDFDLKLVKIPNDLPADLFDKLHFWQIPDRALVSLTIMLGIAAWLLGLSPFSPFTISEELPLVESFSVYYYPDGTTLTQMPGSAIQITYNQKVRVEAVVSPQTNAICKWFTTLGTLLPSPGCSALYTAPLAGDVDTITVHVQPACKTQGSYASLHINVTQP
jgi:hypothetical protein